MAPHAPVLKPASAATRTSRYQRYLELLQQKGPYRGNGGRQTGGSDPYVILAKAISAMLRN